MYAQQSFTDEKRADYVFYIIKYITWQEKLPSEVKVLLLSGNDSLKQAFQAKADQVGKIKGKKIAIETSDQLSAIAQSQIVFVQYDSGFDISDILYELAGKQILLISEGYPFNKSMINFRVLDGKREFELNKPRLMREGFLVDPLFAVHAIKNKADWEKLYLEAEDEISEQKQKVKELGQDIEEKKKILSEQLSKIQKQKSEIESQKDHIAEQLKELNNLYAEISQKEIELAKKEAELEEKVVQIEERKKEISEQKKELLFDKNRIKGLDHLARQKQKEIQEQNAELEKQVIRIRNQQNLIYVFGVMILLVLVAAYYMLRAYRIKKQSNKMLQEKNEEIVAQNEHIVIQRDQILEQKQEITDSIQYASRIQRALLSPEDIVKNTVADHFILYRPRDIVSGDYYWMTEFENNLIAVAADCTGHGVPGAFMSMLGMAFLNEIVKEKQISDTGEVLSQLRSYIMKTLNQEGREETKDGMDMSVCYIEKDTRKMYCSAAYNSVYISHNGELVTLKADRMPVGLSDKAGTPFSVQEYQLEEGDMVYMLSDGYVDQFGGPKGKKFMTKRFKNLILEIADKPMAEQQVVLEKALDDWMGDTEQIDDILVFGIKV